MKLNSVNGQPNCPTFADYIHLEGSYSNLQPADAILYLFSAQSPAKN